MVDRERAPARTAPAEAIGADHASLDSESHDTPVRDAARVDEADADADEQLASLFSTDPGGEAETRRVSSYPLPADDAVVVVIPPLRTLDPSLEFAEASWPEDFGLDESGLDAVVDDDDDVVTMAGPLQRPARAARAPVPPMSAPGEEPATLRKAPSVQDTLGERSEPPPGPADPGNRWAADPSAPGASVGASLLPRPALAPEVAPRARASERALRAVVYVVMTLLGGAIAAVIHAPSSRPSVANAPVNAPTNAPAIAPTIATVTAPLLPAPPVSAEPVAPRPSASVEEAMPPVDEAEAAAVDALGRLREGVGNCVRQGIGTLPGSSPAVPRMLTMTRAPGFLALAPDWNSAFWSCARFRIVGPMRFQLQWQIQKPSVEGLGVAWIDRDGDGTPDRAYAFRVTMPPAKGEVELGEIAPIAATHPLLPVY